MAFESDSNSIAVKVHCPPDPASVDSDAGQMISLNMFIASQSEVDAGQVPINGIIADVHLGGEPIHLGSPQLISTASTT